MDKSALRAVMLGLAAAVAFPIFAQANDGVPPPATVESKGVATATGERVAPPATIDSKGVATVEGSATDNKAVATLRVDGGVIMVSDGGAFVSAIPNQTVVSGERLMVSKDSVATVIYNDGCEQKYDKAGVYKIEPGCARAAAFSGGAANPWKAVAIVATAISGAAVAKMVHDDNCDCCDPVSR